MKKLLLFSLMMVVMVATSMAAIDTTKEYRIKDTGTGYYLNAGNYQAHTSGTNGGVNVVAYAESDDQIFTISASGSNYTLKTKSGYNIVCQPWNVDALTSAGTALTFVDNGNGTYYIMNGSNYFKVENVGGVYYPFCDAESSLKATWELEAIQVANAPMRTISVSASPVEGGVVTVDGQASVTKEGPVTISATANEGFRFVKWTLDGVDISTNTSFTNNVEGDKSYVAIFADTKIVDKYNAQVCKPAFAKSGNSSFVSAAAIVNGNGIENGTIVLGNLAVQGQNGVADPIVVNPGATFNLNLTYVINWCDITYFQIQSEGSSILYGPFDGTWPTGQPMDEMKNAGMTVNGNTVSLPITVPSDLAPGDIFVVRSLIGESPTSACQTTFSEGAYLDFLFYVDSYKVTVSSSNTEMGVAYIGEEGTTSKTCSSNGTDVVTLTAAAKPGYQFTNWTLNGEVVSTEAVYTTTAVTESRSYVANFEFKPVDPREVKVVSNNTAKGVVSIISPATEGASIVTGEIVTVKATALTTDDVFVNWTVNGQVVSTDATFNYAGAEAVTLQANFASLYAVNITQTTGGIISVKQGTTTITSGDRVAEGSTITVTAKGSGSQWVKTLIVDGVNVMTTDQAQSFTTTVKVNKAVDITAIFGTPALILTYEYSGNGYIEVWSSDSYNEGDEDTTPVLPAGDQFRMCDEVVDGEICIFSFPGAGDQLLSLTINGEEQDLDADLAEYGDIYLEISEPTHIVAVFSGVSTGVESAEVSETSIYAVAGGIMVEVAEATAVEVYSIAGTMVSSKVVSGAETISIAQGIYIVKAGDKVAKVIVK